MERSALIDEVMNKADFEICIVRWAASTEDMDEIIFNSLHISAIGPSGNWSFYSNPDLDVMIEAAASETTRPPAKESMKISFRYSWMKSSISRSTIPMAAVRIPIP